MGLPNNVEDHLSLSTSNNNNNNNKLYYQIEKGKKVKLQHGTKVSQDFSTTNVGH